MPNASARAKFTEKQWDELLDGEIRLVDLSLFDFVGGIPGFRAAVYREAEKRYGWAKTKRKGPWMLQVQGFDCRPEFARSHRGEPEPLPGPHAPIPGPRPNTPTPGESAVEAAPRDLSGWTEDQLLGPCTCGQAPRCAPTCLRAGGSGGDDVSLDDPVS